MPQRCCIGGTGVLGIGIMNDTVDTIRILHFSDLHLFPDRDGTLFGIRTADNLAAAVETARRRHPDHRLAVLTGDVTQHGEPAAFRLADELMAGLGTPVRAVPGNHDPAETMIDLYRGRPIAWEGSLVIGGWQLLFINTSCPEMVGGCLTDTVLRDLERALNTRPGLPALIALHHPPVAVGTPWLDRIGLQKPERLFRLLDRHPRVRALLFGHIHQPFEGERNGVRLLAAPSTYADFAVGGDQPVLTDDPPGFRWLDLHADGRLRTGITRVDRTAPGPVPDRR